MTDEQLLKTFLEPMKSMQIPDDGFTDQVMCRIPAKTTIILSYLWTTFCVLIAGVLFVLFRGWVPVVRGILMLLKNPPTIEQLLMLAISVGVIGGIGICEVLSRERWHLV